MFAIPTPGRALSSAVLCLTSLCALHQVATAQVDPVGPGDRVRVVSLDPAGRPSKVLLVGTFVHLQGDTLLLARATGAADFHTFVLEPGTSLEIGSGRHRKFGKYFAIGLVSTSAAVGALAAMTWSPCVPTGLLSCLLHPESRGEALGMGLMGGAVLGVPVGTVTGLVLKEERWDAMPLPGSGDVKLTLLPTARAQLGLTVALSFGGR
jgi:hypothetical protein